VTKASSLGIGARGGARGDGARFEARGGRACGGAMGIGARCRARGGGARGVGVELGRRKLKAAEPVLELEFVAAEPVVLGLGVAKPVISRGRAQGGDDVA
jgi:hypothetical protein